MHVYYTAVFYYIQSLMINYKMYNKVKLCNLSITHAKIYMELPETDMGRDHMSNWHRFMYCGIC